MNTDLIIHNASQILTMAGGPQRGQKLGDLRIIENGAVVIKGEDIIALGPSYDLGKQYQTAHEIDAEGRVVMPGFVDPHTHLIWAGDRAAEFEMRLAGASYMEIMNAGGGILSTVNQTRDASVDDLVAQAQGRLNRMLAHGTTTAEVKTGYGLEIGSELRMMQAILRLDDDNTMELIPTFLGAHAIPAEFSDDPDGYTDLICDEMLPSLVHWWEENAGKRSLPFVDVFCETGAFNLEQSRRILERAKDLGFPLKIHADEFDGLGGTGLAIELGAVSADHLVHTPREDIQALGASQTVAVSLPCTPFGLAESDYTPAKAILEAGGILSTVRQTRGASVDDLVTQARGRLTRMLEHGTTTAEVKTGYGLETGSELRMMEAILRLDDENPVELVPTFLGAHAIPVEFSDDPDGYTDLICDEMLPSLVNWWEENAGKRSLPFVDVFCETGAFNLEQS